MNGMVIYCERAGAGFWAEPLNALSSLVFVAAAWLALHLYRRLPAAGDGDRRWDLLLLMLSMLALGGASFSWHTFAEPWAERADVIAMLALMNLFVVSFLFRVAGLGTLGVLAALLGLQWTMAYAGNRFPPGLMNGTLFYLPAVAALWLSALYALVRSGRRGLVFALAAALFTVSLAVRGSDIMLCPQLPVGTHFLWHLLNAATIYLLFRGLADTVSCEAHR